MNNKRHVMSGYLIMGVAFMVTLGVQASKANYDAAWKRFGIAVIVIEIITSLWLLLPYIAMGINLRNHAKTRPERVGYDYVVLFLVSAAGLYLYISNLYYSKDAQAPIAMLFFPLYQLAGFLILNAFGSGKRRNISGR
ncbi:MAG: hypothetical protein ACYC69_18065 [Thermodesulfovibrionales bacterium]